MNGHNIHAHTQYKHMHMLNLSYSSPATDELADAARARR